MDILTHRSPLFIDQSIAAFLPSDCPSVQAIATFQASNFQSQVYSIDCHFIPSDCPCILADITNRLPRVPSDFSPYPSDCLLYSVTKRLLLLGKRFLAGRYKFSSFHRDSTHVHSLSYKYRTSTLSLSVYSIETLSLSL